MLPKSKHQLFIGFDDGFKSIKFYNAEMCKVLTSQNFYFLTSLSKRETTPKPMIIDPLPAFPCKGELENNTLQSESQHKINN
jgi:hypothetical protein